MMHPSAWVWLMGVSQAATGSLVAAVWQGAVLSVAVWAGLRFLPKTPAAVRFAVWFGVFVVVAGLPVIALWPHSELQAAGGRGAWLMLDARWSVAIAAAWILASLVRAATLVVAAFRVRALWKQAEPIEIEGMDTVGTRQAKVCVSDQVDRPSVIGFFSPKILIPRWLLERLTPEEMRQIVLHEAGHLGRADDWMNLLQKIALVMFPLNPALDWVERRLCFERELACDERVLQETGAPKAYAACLAALAEYRMGRRGVSLTLALGLAGAGRRQSELGQRVGRILAGDGRMRPAQARLVMGGAMLGLMAGAVALARCPQVVGFSLGASGTIAEAGRAQQGSQAPRMQQVVFHADGMRSGQMRSDAGIPQPLRPQCEAHDDSAAGKPVPLSKRAVVQSSNAAQRDHAAVVQISENEIGQTRTPGYRLVRAREEQTRGRQWVVVTSWSVVDGSRLVRTTLKTSSEDASQDEAQQTSQDQDHRYAAVPVRGGWLVFQL